MTAREIFYTHIAPLIDGRTLATLRQQFASLSYDDYLRELDTRYGLHRIEERQLAAIIGYKDEFFCRRVAEEVIRGSGKPGWKAEQVTSSTDGRMVVIDRVVNGTRQKMYMRGDLVLFKNDVPQAVVTCHEYVDATRLKGAIGEAELWKIASINSTFKKPEFIVFADVLELTDAWEAFLNSGDIKGAIDYVFAARNGRRKDRHERPKLAVLKEFQERIEYVVRTR